jgi:hypothetical protein
MGGSGLVRRWEAAERSEIALTPGFARCEIHQGLLCPKGLFFIYEFNCLVTHIY